MALLSKEEIKNLAAASSQETLKALYVGAGWDGDVDLDLMAIPIKDGKVNESDILYFGSTKNAENKLSVLGDALVHSGDALDGDAIGDDESFTINFEKLGEAADHVVVGVIAYNVDDMSAASDTKLRICDGTDAKATELFQLPMSDDDVEGETILVGATLSRGAEGWTVKNNGEFITKFGKGMEAVRGFAEIAPTYCS